MLAPVVAVGGGAGGGVRSVALALRRRRRCWRRWDAVFFCAGVARGLVPGKVLLQLAGLALAGALREERWG